MFQVYATPGWGSVFVEALLALANEPYELTDVDVGYSPEDRAKLPAGNPLAKLPAIVTPDGTVVIKSGPIALYIAERAPHGLLTPPPGDRLHLAYRSWQINLGMVVDMNCLTDDAPASLADVESIAEQPWFLGEHFTALDVFVSVMTRWSPGREWYRENCPKLHAISVAVDRLSALKEIWARNFGPDKDYQ